MTDVKATPVSVLILAVLALVVLGAGLLLTQRMAQSVVNSQIETNARMWSSYFIKTVPDFDTLLETGEPTDAQVEAVRKAQDFANVFRFKLFAPDGRMTYLSDSLNTAAPAPIDTDLYTHNPEAFAVLNTGQPSIEIEDGRAKLNRPDYYAEVYTPVVVGDINHGIVEVYIDVSDVMARSYNRFVIFGSTLALMVLLLVSLPLWQLWSASRRLATANTKLGEARDAAVAAEEAKGQFLANMSHEIRSPMNGIIGMSELLQESDLTAEQRECAETILSSSTALLNVINDILDFTKSRAGKIQLRETPTDIDALIGDVAALTAPVAEAKGLEIVTETDLPVPLWVQADGARLRQCLINLVGNAIKFTSKGYVTIRVQSHGEGLRLTVEDTGMGIPHDMQSKVFAAFEQVESTDTRDFEGTGLGLAITGELVRLMDGEITLESEPGHGSTFGLNLPLATVPAPPKSLPEVDMAALRGLRAAVIDDLEVNREVLRRRLQSWGMHVDLASNGQDGLAQVVGAQLTGSAPDIVVLDHSMPDMSGVEVIERLRDKPETAGTPILLMSSMLHMGIEEEISQFDRVTYLRKPARSMALASALSQLLSHAPQDAAPTEPDAAAPTVALTLDREVKLLVVDDSAVNQIVIRRMLSELNAEVETANDGDEAIDLFTPGAFDLVLMDLSMPRRDGFETTRALRQMEEKAGVDPCPILAFSAMVLPDERQKALDAGMNESLHKPIRKAELLAAVQHWAGQGGEDPREASTG